MTHRGWGSHGSHGSWGSHGSSGYSSHGSWGSHGSSGYSSHGSSGYASCGSSGGVIHSTPVVRSGTVIQKQGETYYEESTPIQQQDGGAVQEQDVPDLPTDARAKSTQATLLVSVPSAAKVFVNGKATTSLGAQRQFISKNLKPGFNYRYEVRAEVVRDGKTQEQTRVVNLNAGDTANLAFNLNDSPAVAQKEVETVLTVNVPENAKIFLAGRQTASQGEQRIFRTKKLATGQSWNDYTVKVTVEKDGQQLTKQQTIDLAAGDSRELTFGFNDDQLAITEVNQQR